MTDLKTVWSLGNFGHAPLDVMFLHILGCIRVILSDALYPYTPVLCLQHGWNLTIDLVISPEGISQQNENSTVSSYSCFIVNIVNVS